MVRQEEVEVVAGAGLALVVDSVFDDAGVCEEPADEDRESVR